MDGSWVTIHDMPYDESLQDGNNNSPQGGSEEGYQTHTWEVGRGGGLDGLWFDSLRILQTGANSSGVDDLNLSGFELYGTLRER